MSETNKLYLMVVVENSIMMICFTIIAIHFEKWWIILFSVLLYTSVSNKNRKEVDNGTKEDTKVTTETDI